MIEKKYDNAMARQAHITPDFVRQMVERLDESVMMNALPIKELYDAQKIVITGCGDSWLAGVATKPVFENVAFMDTEVWRCVEFSRFFGKKALGYSPNTPLVVGISISGQVSRVIESLRRANEAGANTLAITGSVDTPLAKEAKHVIPLNLPEGEYMPGLNSYVASMIALTLLAIRFAEAKDFISQDQKKEMIDALVDYAASYKALLSEMDERAFEIAKQWKDLRAVDFIGDYADYATAFFGSAKVIECYGGHTTYDDSEDWCHINYFLRDPQTLGRVMVTNEESPSFDRTLETLEAIRKLESPCMVVTDADKSVFPASFEVFTTPKPKYFWMAPLMQHLPFDFVAGYIGALMGVAGFREDDPKWTELPFKHRKGRLKESEIVII